MIYALAFFLFVLAGVNYFRYRDPLYPAFIQAGLWALLAMLLAISETHYWQLQMATTFAFGMGAICFTVGCFVATRGFRPTFERVREVTGGPGRGVRFTLVVAAALVLPLYIQRALVIAAQGPVDSFFVSLRWMLSYGGASFGHYAYGTPLAFVAAFAALTKLLHSNRTWGDVALFGVALVVAVAYAVMSSGRTWIFMLLFVLFVPPVSLRVVQAGRAGLTLVVILVGMFILLGVVLRSATGVGSFSDALSASGDAFVHYLLGSSYAFDALLRVASPLDLGANSGRFFFALARAIGYDVDVKELVQEFSYPFDTNVYTVYQPYFLDFDLAFAVLMQLPFGVLHGALYRRATRHVVKEWHLFAFSLSIYPLFMQFFQDQYVNLLSTWLQFALIGWVAFGGYRLVKGLTRSGQSVLAAPSR